MYTWWNTEEGALAIVNTEIGRKGSHDRENTSKNAHDKKMVPEAFEAGG